MTSALETPTRTPVTRRTVAIRATTAVIGAVVLLAGTAGVVSFFMVHTDDDTTVFRDPVNRVRVNIEDAGRVRINAGPAEQQATVVSHRISAFRTADHHESVRDGLLDVTSECRGGLMIVADSCRVNFEITVAPGTAVNVVTAVGDASVSGINGAVNVDTDTGDIRVHRTTGPVRLSTDTGDITADQINGGTVVTDTDTGDIRLSFRAAPDRTTITSDTGDLRLQVPKDGTLYRVLTDPTVGDTTIDLPTSSDSHRTIKLSTDTGDIRAEARLN
jgi:DUF4097 and DUF4098 domain-containing protein YvlB